MENSQPRTYQYVLAILILPLEITCLIMANRIVPASSLESLIVAIIAVLSFYGLLKVLSFWMEFGLWKRNVRSPKTEDRSNVRCQTTERPSGVGRLKTEIMSEVCNPSPVVGHLTVLPHIAVSKEEDLKVGNEFQVEFIKAHDTDGYSHLAVLHEISRKTILCLTRFPVSGKVRVVKGKSGLPELEEITDQFIPQIKPADIRERRDGYELGHIGSILE